MLRGAGALVYPAYVSIRQRMPANNVGIHQRMPAYVSVFLRAGHTLTYARALTCQQRHGGSKKVLRRQRCIGLARQVTVGREVGAD